MKNNFPKRKPMPQTMWKETKLIKENNKLNQLWTCSGCFQFCQIKTGLNEEPSEKCMLQGG